MSAAIVLLGAGAAAYVVLGAWRLIPVLPGLVRYVWELIR